MTGYAGVELARLLWRHPQVSLCAVTGRSAAGKKLAEVFPHLIDIDLTITETLEEDVDLVFSAMPHKASAEAVLPLLEKNVRIVDISADFRLKNPALYQQWYDFAHPRPDMLNEAVYGLPELYRSAIKQARVVANPGCYPTGAILALAPALKAGILQPDIIIDSKSGLSGAGRALSLTTHYAEANEDVRAYSLKGHRHLPEIVQELAVANNGIVPDVTFLPHLVPATRGILSTCYARRVEGKQEDTAGLIGLYKEFYKDEPFVRVLETPMGSKTAWGSNTCFVYPYCDVKTGRVVVVSAIDNLVKGAAGQAIQNMNIMCGFVETAGLEALPVYP